MKRLKLKYSKEAIIPYNLVRGLKSFDEVVSLVTGENVQFELVRYFNTKLKKPLNDLDSLCKDMYDMSFNAVKNAWISRIGDIDECWYLVRLHEVNESEVTNDKTKRLSRKRRK